MRKQQGRKRSAVPIVIANFLRIPGFILVVMGLLGPSSVGYPISRAYAEWRLRIDLKDAPVPTMASYYRQRLSDGEMRGEVESRFPGWVRRRVMGARGSTIRVLYSFDPLNFQIMEITYADGTVSRIASPSPDSLIAGIRLGIILLVVGLPLFVVGEVILRRYKRQPGDVPTPSLPTPEGGSP